MIDNFKAYVVREGKNGVFSGQIETKKFDDPGMFAIYRLLQFM